MPRRTRQHVSPGSTCPPSMPRSSPRGFCRCRTGLPARYNGGMVTQEQRAAVLSEIDRELAAVSGAESSMDAAMRTISRQLPHYNWVGVYLLNGDALELGPYVGAATDHTRIPVGRGVCGTAVAQNANQVIDDVRTLDNYLACSVETRSEIVVLIRDPRDGSILGQIDADGHAVGAFDASDEALLEEIAARLAPRLGRAS